jgi:undecaprenyl-diphosphatase
VSLWIGILLGVVQGLTEFFPVSSSAHLVLIQVLIPSFEQPGVLFDAVLHLGTVFSVLYFLRREIAALLLSLLPSSDGASSGGEADGFRESGRRIILLLLIGTAITAAVGLTFKDAIHDLFRSVETTAAALLVTGALLLLADRIKAPGRTERDLSFPDAVVIGIAQSVALVPGISRSGSTIAFGIFRKLSRETAARFSFLLSVPAVLGAAILEARYATAVSVTDWPVYLAGFLAAAGAGFVALKVLFTVLNRRGLSVFAYYCWAVGVLTLVLRSL